MPVWHTLSTFESLRELNADDRGLSVEEARRRRERYGDNLLPTPRERSRTAIFFSQFESPLIYLLIAASGVVFLQGDTADGTIILAVLIVNAVVGFLQEGKAQRTMFTLRRYIRTEARALRVGDEVVIEDSELVPGDVVLLEAGDKVPADGRILSAAGFEVDESALTGESLPVPKTEDPLETERLSTAEQRNMVFRGTYAVSGNARILIVATGLKTVIGAISERLSLINTEVPLHEQIRKLSNVIMWTVALTSVLLVGAGLLRGYSVGELFNLAVALAVSAIPEGLPVVVTLVLARGVWRMAKRNVLVKRLAAVEALGQADVIALDKTGTVTRNEMVVSRVYTDDTLYDVSADGYAPTGDVGIGGVPITPPDHPELLLAAKIAVFASNAHVFRDDASGLWRAAGEPTEAALLVFGRKIGFHKEDLERENPRRAEVPFSSNEKYHAVLNVVPGGGLFLSVVGAPESILKRAHSYYRGRHKHHLEPPERARLLSVAESLSSEGYRVLALATGETTHPSLNAETLPPLEFVGFVAVEDAIRSEAYQAVGDVRRAGVRLVMITGDHPRTAVSVARSLGIYREGDGVLVDGEIDTRSDEELSQDLRGTSVLARVTPEHKLRIIEAYRKAGLVVAMTGDGVNDALSLEAAHLGVAMGRSGTEVAKEAADIVLMDDNFGSIVVAIEEGRMIYKTIKKVVLYLLSTSAGEVLAIIGALVAGLPIPLAPSQIIWLNFVTDGFLVVALAMDRDTDRLNEEERKTSVRIVDRLMIERIVIIGVVMAWGTLLVFSRYVGSNYAHAATIAMTALAVYQWFNVWNCGSDYSSVFRRFRKRNWYVVGALIVVVGLQLVALYTSFGHTFLHTVPLSLRDWTIVVALAFSVIVAEEVRKFFGRFALWPRESGTREVSVVSDVAHRVI